MILSRQLTASILLSVRAGLTRRFSGERRPAKRGARVRCTRVSGRCRIGRLAKCQDLKREPRNPNACPNRVRSLPPSPNERDVGRW